MLTNACHFEADLSEGEKSAQLNYRTRVALTVTSGARYLKGETYIAIKP